MDLTESEAAMEAAILAASAALIGATIAAWVTLRTERSRRAAEREAEELRVRAADDAEELKLLRDRTAQVFYQLFAIQHEMEWITWHARHHPETVDGAMVRAYESAVHAAYPKALGAMALVAAMDQELYKSLKAELDVVYSLDASVANAALSVPSPGAVLSLSELNAPARDVYEVLPIKMADAMRTAEVRTRRGRDN